MQTTAGPDGHTYTLAAQTAADFAFIDALDEHHAVAVQQITRRAWQSGGYTASSAVLTVNSKSPEALEAQTARQFLRAVRELLRLGLGEDALHSHIGLDTANPKTQEQIAALLKQLQLVLQLGTLAICKPEGVREKVDAAHSDTPCSEKAIVAQGGAA